MLTLLHYKDHKTRTEFAVNPAHVIALRLRETGTDGVWEVSVLVGTDDHIIVFVGDAQEARDHYNKITREFEKNLRAVHKQV